MSLKPLLKGREKCLLALGPCELGSRGLRHPYTHHITFIQEENGAVVGVTQKSWGETDEGKGRLAKTFADDSAYFFTRSPFPYPSLWNPDLPHKNCPLSAHSTVPTEADS